ncbi:hypothetical protein C8R46DRAFT_1320170 [Mycena filopes]|nr:hypothetical protein C8R46DRAFT_1320170 [Mycena filopes]
MASNTNTAHPVVPEGFLLCDTCKTLVKVGSGGIANLQENHEGKPKCLARKKENDLVEKFGPKPVKKKPIFAPLNSYFFKPKEIVPSKVAAPPSLHGTPVTPADSGSIRPVCTLFFTKRRGAKSARQIDWTRSKCSNPVNFNMKTAMTFSEPSPCTNFPVQCSLCDADSPLVWTYNLAAHYARQHNRQMGPYTYLSSSKDSSLVPYTRSKQEEKLGKARFSERYNKKVQTKKSSRRPPLPISEAHSSRMTLRTNLNSIPEDSAADTEAEIRAHIAEHSARSTNSDSDSPSDAESEESIPLSEGDDFGAELTQPESPGPVPASYPHEDDEALEYLDGSEVPQSRRQLEIAALEAELQHFEVENPPPADLEALQTTPATSSNTLQHDWELPFTAGSTTRVGRQRRVRAAAIGTCDCGEMVSEAERKNLELVVQCTRAGCETEWYHRACVLDVFFQKNWVCMSCMRTKKQRN